ncbi:tetratricopeptide repeat protein [Streptomyces sp. 3N207]|uniref:tetratricopeptide repeat protein n=1 Tax=Streptomyces sp. 3N207 TaxID=3457417 RepID=UPI003FD113A8
MEEILEESALRAGWTAADSEPTGSFHGPNGARVRFVRESDGVAPDRWVILLECASAARPRCAFAIPVMSQPGGLSGEQHRRRIVSVALAAPALVHAGAARQWWEAHGELPMWARQDDGPWLPVVKARGAQRRSTVVPAPDEATTVRIDNFWEELAGDPLPGAISRADRTRTVLKAAGWRDTTGRSARRRHGRRIIAAFSYRDPRGGSHRCAYVLTGDPRLPEALWWHCDLPAPPGSADDDRVRAELLLDVTGENDPDLPFAAPAGGVPGADALGGRGDARLGSVLRLLTERVPESPATYAQLVDDLTLTTTVVDLGRPNHPARHFSGYLRSTSRPSMDPGPSTSAGTWDECVAALRAQPRSAAHWRAMGGRAAGDRRAHLAVAAYRQALALEGDDGETQLMLAWFRHRTDPNGALVELERAEEAGAPGTWRLRAEIQLDHLGDPEGALTTLRAAVEEDRATPSDPGSWQALGSALLDTGRSADAARVLAEGAGRHPDQLPLLRQLVTARLSAGEHEGTLDALEDLVSHTPSEIDRVLRRFAGSGLGAELRFQRLPAVALAAQRDRHRRVREAARPAVTPELGSADARVEAFANLCADAGFQPCPLTPDALDSDVTEPVLRRLLCEVGMPTRVTGVDFVRSVTRKVPRLIAWQRHRGGSESSMYDRDFAIHGLCRFGNAGAPDRALAVDGASGDVFRVVVGRPGSSRLTWLAPGMDVFFASIQRVADSGDD